MLGRMLVVAHRPGAAVLACYQQVLAHDPANVAAGNDLALSIALSGGPGVSAKILQKLMMLAEDQNLDLQRDALERAGRGRIYEDRASGARADRPGQK